MFLFEKGGGAKSEQKSEAIIKIVFGSDWFGLKDLEGLGGGHCTSPPTASVTPKWQAATKARKIKTTNPNQLEPPRQATKGSMGPGHQGTRNKHTIQVNMNYSAFECVGK